MGKFIDLSGKTFGYLKIIGRLPNDKFKKVVWKCLCICGNYTNIITQHLKYHNTISCGCFKKQYMKNKMTKHGESNKTRTYEIWKGISKRCYNKKSPFFKYYGGRGITVCDRWNPKKGGSFKNFLKDMGRCPSIEHSIDRIDNNGDYCPKNCRWATRIEQARNTRGNHKEEYNGKTKCLSEWEEEYNLPKGLLYSRINQSKMSIGKALNKPVRIKNNERKL